MTKEISIVEKDVVRAIEWAAAEYKYVLELKEELEKIEKDSDLAQKSKDLHHALSIFRYLGKAERRAYRYEKRVNEDLEERYKAISGDKDTHGIFSWFKKRKKAGFMEHQRFETQLHLQDHLGEGFGTLQDFFKQIRALKIEEETLAKWASLYGGLLKKELKEAEMLASLEEDVEKKYGRIFGNQKKNKNGAQQLDARLTAMLFKIKEQIGSAKTWLEGIEATLKRAQKILTKLDYDSKQPLTQDGYGILKENGFHVEKHRQLAYLLAQYPLLLEGIVENNLRSLGQHSFNRLEFLEMFDGSLQIKDFSSFINLVHAFFSDSHIKNKYDLDDFLKKTYPLAQPLIGKKISFEEFLEGTSLLLKEFNIYPNSTSFEEIITLVLPSILKIVASGQTTYTVAIKDTISITTKINGYKTCNDKLLNFFQYLFPPLYEAMLKQRITWEEIVAGLPNEEQFEKQFNSFYPGSTSLLSNYFKFIAPFLSGIVNRKNWSLLILYLYPIHYPSSRERLLSLLSEQKELMYSKPYTIPKLALLCCYDNAGFSSLIRPLTPFHESITESSWPEIVALLLKAKDQSGYKFVSTFLPVFAPAIKEQRLSWQTLAKTLPLLFPFNLDGDEKLLKQIAKSPLLITDSRFPDVVKLIVMSITLNHSGGYIVPYFDIYLSSLNAVVEEHPWIWQDLVEIFLKCSKEKKDSYNLYIPSLGEFNKNNASYSHLISKESWSHLKKILMRGERNGMKVIVADGFMDCVKAFGWAYTAEVLSELARLAPTNVYDFNSTVATEIVVPELVQTKILWHGKSVPILNLDMVEGLIDIAPYLPVNKFIPPLADFINEKTWPKLVKLVKNLGWDVKETLLQLTSSFKEFNLNPKDQQIVFNNLLTFLLAPGMFTEYRFKVSCYLYFDFLSEEFQSGKKPSEINVKDFWRYVKDLEKRKIIGNLSKGQLVVMADQKDSNVYHIKSLNKSGYFLKRATMQDITKIDGPYLYSQVREFKESDDWTSISQLREKGFLIIHTANAFAGGQAKTEGIDYDAFQSIERDIKSGDKYTISCSGISPLYGAGVCQHRDKTYSIGVVLSKGKIVAAFPGDAATENIHAQYRKPSISMFNLMKKQVPVRMALTISQGYNELIPQHWGVDGVFYTTKTPPEDLNKLKEIAIKYKLELYAIEEHSINWKIYRYNGREFELAFDTKSSLHLFKEAV